METRSNQTIHGSLIPQITIEFTSGELARHKNLLSCVVGSVYGGGLSNSAKDLGIPVGNLSAQLSTKNKKRYFSIENFERHLEASKDFSSIYYLIEKFLVKRGD